jgi:hypothetical protein
MIFDSYDVVMLPIRKPIPPSITFVNTIVSSKPPLLSLLFLNNNCAKDVTCSYFLWMHRSFLTVKNCSFKGSFLLCFFWNYHNSHGPFAFVSLTENIGFDPGVGSLSFDDSPSNLILGFINAFYDTLIENSTFTNVTGNYGGIINIMPILPNVNINITHCLFINNFMTFGGVLFFNPYLRRNHTIFVQHSTFVQNSAYQGGAVFFERFPNLTMRNCNVYNNFARYYGHTFATLAERFVWKKEIKIHTIHSGGTLPEYSVQMLDLFSQFVAPLSMNKDFVYVNITVLCDQNVSPCLAAAATEVGKPLLNENDNTSFTKTDIIGYPGNYTLRIAPAIIYDRSRFSLDKRITILPCQSPNVLYKNDYEMFSRCILRTFFDFMLSIILTLTLIQ